MVVTLHGCRDRRSEARAPLKVGIFNWRDIRHPKAGGAEEYLHRQAVRWIADGHAVKWCAASFPGSAPQENVDGVEIFRAGGEYTVYAHAPLVYAKHMRDCDVLLDSENGIPFFTPLFSAKPKLLLIYHVHRDVLLAALPKPLNYIAWALEVWAMPLVYRHVSFVTISESSKEDLVRYGYTHRPISVVHSGVDHHILAPGAKSRLPTIVYVGRVVRYKRVDKLVEAFAAVLGTLPAAELVIAGVGEDLQRCRNKAQELGVVERVHFEGRVTEKRKAELLASGWAFAHPSSIEGWGISIMEAAASSTPAVARRVRGLKDAIIDGETGLLADTWPAFVRALLLLLTDNALRLRMSEASRKRAEGFTWERAAAQMLEQLESAQRS